MRYNRHYTPYDRTPSYVPEAALGVEFDTNLLFAAAVMVAREYGNEYHSEDKSIAHVDAEGNVSYSVLLANKKVLANHLADVEKLNVLITDEDRVVGENCRDHYKGLLFKILADEASDFENTAYKAAINDTQTSTQIGVISCLPVFYPRNKKQNETKARIDAGTPLNVELNKRVTIDIEIVRSTYSDQWSTFFNTALTEANEVVSFSSSTGYDVGAKMTITGTAKGVKYGAMKLNRVKVV